jgi:hypothetical protein
MSYFDTRDLQLYKILFFVSTLHIAVTVKPPSQTGGSMACVLPFMACDFSMI